MVKRHVLVNAVRYPGPQDYYELTPLARPVTLTDVLERHPEWRRRLILTLRAKQAGRPIPKFPLLEYCQYCQYDYLPQGRKLFCARCGRQPRGKSRKR